MARAAMRQMEVPAPLCGVLDSRGFSAGRGRCGSTIASASIGLTGGCRVPRGSSCSPAWTGRSNRGIIGGCATLAVVSGRIVPEQVINDVSDGDLHRFVGLMFVGGRQNTELLVRGETAALRRRGLT